MQLRLRISLTQGLEAIAQAAACIKYPGAFRQGCLRSQVPQGVGGGGEKRGIAPGIQGINQQQQHERQQPGPGRQGPCAEQRQREGNFFLDFLNVQRITSITGWRFEGLIVLIDDTVLFRNFSGEARIDRTDRLLNPLGPFQPAGESAGRSLLR